MLRLEELLFSGVELQEVSLGGFWPSQQMLSSSRIPTSLVFCMGATLYLYFLGLQNMLVGALSVWNPEGAQTHQIK